MTRVPLQAILLIIFVQVLWGGNPVAVKFGLEAFPPLWSGFLRFTVAIFCLLVWARIRGISMIPQRHEWNPLLLLAFVFFIQIWAMNVGFDMSTGAISSILISTHPLFAALFAFLMVKGEQATLAKLVGMAIAFVGTVVIILRGGGLSAKDFSLTGAIIILISSVLLGYRLILASQQAKQIDTIRVVTWQMLLPLWAFALGGFVLEDINWSNMGWLPVSGILYQGIVIAGLGFMVNTWMLKTYSPSVVVSFGFLAPISGVMLSIWLLGEAFTWVVAIGTVSVGAGLILITKGPGKKRADKKA